MGNYQVLKVKDWDDFLLSVTYVNIATFNTSTKKQHKWLVFMFKVEVAVTHKTYRASLLVNTALNILNTRYHIIVG